MNLCSLCQNLQNLCRDSSAPSLSCAFYERDGVTMLVDRVRLKEDQSPKDHCNVFPNLEIN